MLISHGEAHKLIQLNTDALLDLARQRILNLHLEDCAECRGYAEGIKETETLLQHVMKRQWNVQPLPLSTQSVLKQTNQKQNKSFVLATRLVASGVVFVVFVFSIWQWTISNGSPSQSPLSVAPIPTPSTQLTSTKIEECKNMRYIVQKNDTLDSIASQFSLPKEIIMITNNMKTDQLYVNMEIILPLCNFTPTSTVRPPTSTVTHTPQSEGTSYTPEGG